MLPLPRVASHFRLAGAGVETRAPAPASATSHAGHPVSGPSSWDTPHLVFEVDSQSYASPIRQIKRLLRAADVEMRPRRPDSPAWEVGQLVIEEETTPVISLRSLWDLPAIADSARHRVALLVVNVRTTPIALMVDACACVVPHLPSESTAFLLPASLKSARSRGLTVAVPWNQRLLVRLEPDELFAPGVLETPSTGPGSTLP